VRDSGAGVPDAVLSRRRRTGVGLSNIERRLAGYYGASASLSIVSKVGAGTTVELRVPAERRPASKVLPLKGGRSVS